MVHGHVRAWIVPFAFVAHVKGSCTPLSVSTTTCPADKMSSWACPGGATDCASPAERDFSTVCSPSGDSVLGLAACGYRWAADSCAAGATDIAFELTSPTGAVALEAQGGAACAPGAGFGAGGGGGVHLDGVDGCLRAPGGAGSFLDNAPSTLKYGAWFRAEQDWHDDTQPDEADLVSKNSGFGLRLGPSGDNYLPSCHMYLDGTYVGTGSGDYVSGWDHWRLIIHDNHWHHVACWYDGHSLRLFKDGVLAMQKDGLSGTVGVPGSGNLAVDTHFGCQNGNNLHFKGTLDEVFVDPLNSADCLGPAPYCMPQPAVAAPNACTPTEVAHSDRSAPDTITGLTGDVTEVTCDSGYWVPHPLAPTTVSSQTSVSVSCAPTGQFGPIVPCGTHWTADTDTCSPNGVPEMAGGQQLSHVGGSSCAPGFAGTGGVALDGVDGCLKADGGPNSGLQMGALVGAVTFGVRFKADIADWSVGPSATHNLFSMNSNFGLKLGKSGARYSPSCHVYVYGLDIPEPQGYKGLGAGNEVGGYGYFDRVITDNDWHELVCSYDGQSLKMFKDGILMMERGDLPGGKVGRPGNTGNNNQPVYIGCQNGVNSFFGGTIDEAYVSTDAGPCVGPMPTCVDSAAVVSPCKIDISEMACEDFEEDTDFLVANDGTNHVMFTNTLPINGAYLAIGNGPFAKDQTIAGQAYPGCMYHQPDSTTAPVVTKYGPAIATPAADLHCGVDQVTACAAAASGQAAMKMRYSLAELVTNLDDAGRMAIYYHRVYNNPITGSSIEMLWIAENACKIYVDIEFSCTGGNCVEVTTIVCASFAGIDTTNNGKLRIECKVPPGFDIAKVQNPTGAAPHQDATLTVAENPTTLFTGVTPSKNFVNGAASWEYISPNPIAAAGSAAVVVGSVTVKGSVTDGNIQAGSAGWTVVEDIYEAKYNLSMASPTIDPLNMPVAIFFYSDPTSADLGDLPSSAFPSSLATTPFLSKQNVEYGQITSNVNAFVRVIAKVTAASHWFQDLRVSKVEKDAQGQGYADDSTLLQSCYLGGNVADNNADILEIASTWDSNNYPLATIRCTEFIADSPSDTTPNVAAGDIVRLTLQWSLRKVATTSGKAQLLQDAATSDPADQSVAVQLTISLGADTTTITVADTGRGASADKTTTYIIIVACIVAAALLVATLVAMFLCLRSRQPEAAILPVGYSPSKAAMNAAYDPKPSGKAEASIDV